MMSMSCLCHVYYVHPQEVEARVRLIEELGLVSKRFVRQLEPMKRALAEYLLRDTEEGKMLRMALAGREAEGDDKKKKRANKIYSEAVEEEAGPKPWNCRLCTQLNNADAEACSSCGRAQTPPEDQSAKATHNFIEAFTTADKSKDKAARAVAAAGAVTAAAMAKKWEQRTQGRNAAVRAWRRGLAALGLRQTYWEAGFFDEVRHWWTLQKRLHGHFRGL